MGGEDITGKRGNNNYLKSREKGKIKGRKELSGAGWRKRDQKNNNGVRIEEKRNQRRGNSVQ